MAPQGDVSAVILSGRARPAFLDLLAPKVRTLLEMHVGLHALEEARGWEWTKLVRTVKDVHGITGRGEGLRAFLDAYDRLPAAYHVTTSRAPPPPDEAAETLTTSPAKVVRPPLPVAAAASSEPSGSIYCYSTRVNPRMYKAGFTHGDVSARFAGYTGLNRPGRTIGVGYVQCDVRAAETRMLEALRRASSVLRPRTDLGKEWFEAVEGADVEVVHAAISRIISNVVLKRPVDAM